MRNAPDVVLSYSRLDRDEARRFAQRLEDCGLKVSWDEPIIAPDEDRERTAAALRAAKAAVVLWTPHAVDNRLVVEEATAAARQGKLVGLRLNGIAGADLPAGLGNGHALAPGDAAALATALAARGIKLTPDQIAVLAPEPEQKAQPAPAATALGTGRPLGSLHETRTLVVEPVAQCGMAATRPAAETLTALEESAPRAPAPNVVALAPPAPIAVPEPEPKAAVRPAKPVLHLRRRQAPASGTRASALVLAGTFCVIVLALLLTSGLLHAIGIGR